MNLLLNWHKSGQIRADIYSNWVEFILDLDVYTLVPALLKEPIPAFVPAPLLVPIP